MLNHSIWISLSFTCLIIQFLSHYAFPVQLYLFNYLFRVPSFFSRLIILFVLNNAYLTNYPCLNMQLLSHYQFPVQLSFLDYSFYVEKFNLDLIILFMSDYPISFSLCISSTIILVQLFISCPIILFTFDYPFRTR